MSSWPDSVVPVCHLSESRSIEQGEEKESPAHSDFIRGTLETYGESFDVVFEAKKKELSVQSFLAENQDWNLW